MGCDLAWIGMKLRKLLNYAETNGSFMARIPGRQGANVAVDHRLSGAVDDSPLRDARPPDREGYPWRCRHLACQRRAGEHRGAQTSGRQEVPEVEQTMIRKDGCDFCTACGHTWSVG